tara:strand:+ start:84 stop:1079 length:996 start_codon:yes stop_codon:yes gene_type:complete
MVYDVVTVGGVTRDVYLTSKDMKVVKDKRFARGKGLAFALGSKLLIDDLNFTIGGGSVNPAVTFKNYGYNVAPMVVLGKDPVAKEITDFLKERKISSDLVFKNPEDITAHSIILSAGKTGRTILEYPGVKWSLVDQKIPWNNMKGTKWFYITHLGGKSAKLLPQIISFATKNNIKIAWNPGRTQLESVNKMIPLLKYVDLVSLNQEEATMVAKVPYEKRKDIFKKLDNMVQGIVVMTRGPKGVEVSDGSHVWSAGILPMNDIVDRTGAGDAFGSAFVSSLITKPNDIERAIQLASANATGVLREWGPTNGLLKKGDSITQWGKLKIRKTKV